MRQQGRPADPGRTPMARRPPSPWRHRWRGDRKPCPNHRATSARPGRRLGRPRRCRPRRGRRAGGEAHAGWRCPAGPSTPRRLIGAGAPGARPAAHAIVAGHGGQGRVALRPPCRGGRRAQAAPRRRVAGGGGEGAGTPPGGARYFRAPPPGARALRAGFSRFSKSQIFGSVFPNALKIPISRRDDCIHAKPI